MERTALDELFEATKGTCWYRKWNWSSQCSHRQWEGISIDCSGHVIGIQLIENNLQGSLVELNYISKLINLELLVLSCNSIRGMLSNNIGKLTSLHTLDLSWNQLSGSGSTY
jgi:hypothetical protein